MYRKGRHSKYQQLNLPSRRGLKFSAKALDLSKPLNLRQLNVKIGVFLKQVHVRVYNSSERVSLERIPEVLTI